MEKENKKSKILYILGAGASAKALPVINEMPNRLKMYFAFLLSYNIYNEYLTKEPPQAISPSYEYNRKDLLDKINKLIIKAGIKEYIDNEKFGYVDTIFNIINDLEDYPTIDIMITNKKDNKELYQEYKHIYGLYLALEESFIDNDLRRLFLENFIYAPSSSDKSTFTENYFNDLFFNKTEKDIKSKIKNDMSSFVIINSFFAKTEETRGLLKKYENIFIDGFYELFKIDENKNYTNNKDKQDIRYINFINDLSTTYKYIVDEDRIKIFSWNYDNQLDVMDEKLAEDRQKVRDLLKRVKNKTENISNDFPIKTELNGNYKDDFIFIDAVGINKKGNRGSIKFVEDGELESIYSKEDLKNICNIVIIGYSFPNCNYEVDANIIKDIILNSFKNKNAYIHNLQKIYIQTNSKESFESIKFNLEQIIDNLDMQKEIDLIINGVNQAETEKDRNDYHKKVIKEKIKLVPINNYINNFFIPRI